MYGNKENMFKPDGISITREEPVDDNENPDYNIKTWDDLELDTNILRGIFAYGFENPSPIQQKAIKPILTGKDVIAQAQSGTGKTGMFVIGGLSKIDLSNRDSQILCLSPTRELSIQTANVVNKIGSMMKNLTCHTLIGGSPIDNDIKLIKNEGAQFLVGCPGRVYDLFRRSKQVTNSINMVILDEADEMLSSGFKEQIYAILQLLKTDIQIIICSATMPSYTYEITNQFLKDPIEIKVKAEQLTLEGIKQYYVPIEDDLQKYLCLKDLYSIISVSQSIIYANSVKRVADLYDALNDDGFSVCCIHSQMSKYEREDSLTKFRNGTSRIMISSNVTARGIDIQQVSIVINFDIPKDISVYLHRIGRSGRWGRKGTGINLITRRDISKLKEIEGYYHTQIDPLPGDFSV